MVDPRGSWQVDTHQDRLCYVNWVTHSVSICSAWTFSWPLTWLTYFSSFCKWFGALNNSVTNVCRDFYKPQFKHSRAKGNLMLHWIKIGNCHVTLTILLNRIGRWVQWTWDPRYILLKTKVSTSKRNYGEKLSQPPSSLCSTAKVSKPAVFTFFLQEAKWGAIIFMVYIEVWRYQWDSVCNKGHTVALNLNTTRLDQELL